MTRRHFQWAADYIAGYCCADDARIIAEFCVAMFRHFNSRFDRERFMRAAEVTDHED